VDKPTEFGGNHAAIPHGDITAFAECLYSVKLGIADLRTVYVPQSGAAVFGHFAVGKIKSVNVPEGIAKVEITVAYAYYLTFLEGAFSVGGAVKNTVIYRNGAASVKGALFVKGFVFYYVHFVYPYKAIFNHLIITLFAAYCNKKEKANTLSL
jgi:hypothetical protein